MVQKVKDQGVKGSVLTIKVEKHCSRDCIVQFSVFISSLTGYICVNISGRLSFFPLMVPPEMGSTVKIIVEFRIGKLKKDIGSGLLCIMNCKLFNY